jgi:hypothetical protein
MKRALALALLAAWLFTNCDPGGPSEPELLEAQVTVASDTDKQPTAALRIAVVWRYDDGTGRRWLSTYDAPVRSRLGRQFITLTLPSASQRAGLTDLATLHIRCSDNADMVFDARVVLPRVVVYEDVDGSENLDIDVPLGGGVDRVWGIADKSFVPLLAFLDLDQVLSSHPLEAAACIREATNGQYSAFLQGRYASGYLWPTDSPINLYVHLTATDQARVALYCGYQNETFLTSPTDVLYSPSENWVDAELSQDICSTSKSPCSRGDRALLTWPNTKVSSTPGVSRTALCYVYDNLDVLLVTESRLECQACQCAWKGRVSRWIVDHARAPAGWPCGTRVQYCSTPVASVWEPPATSCRTVNDRPL